MTLMVGDVVVVTSGAGDRPRRFLRKVRRVMKRFVELNDGSRWSRTGKVYPSQEWSTSYMTPLAECPPGTATEIERERLAREMHKFDWHDVSVEKLRAIRGILEAEKT